MSHNGHDNEVKVRIVRSGIGGEREGSRQQWSTVAMARQDGYSVLFEILLRKTCGMRI